MEFDLSKINRILVRGVNWVGDTILSYPTVQGLKTLFPHCHLAILVPNHLVDLWKTFPYVDEIIPFQRRGSLGSLWEDLNLIRSIKRRRFDIVVILPRSFRSAYQIYLTRIPVRIGYQDEGRSVLLTHGIPRTRETLRVHRINYYRKLIEPLGKVETALLPHIFIRGEDRKWADQMLRGFGLLNGRPLIGINPGATYGLAKCWYPSRFGELGKRLFKRWKATALIFGKEEEQAIAKEILKFLEDGGIDLTGQTHLLQLAALLERCHLLITNDTGTMHVATAVGTPVVALFGSTDHIATGPLGEGDVVVRKEVPCSPCLKRVCPTDHRCMELITVDEVEEIVSKKLEELIK